MRRIVALLALSFCFSQALHAQSQLAVPRFEAGLQFDVSYLSGVGNWGGGIGGRFDYNFTPHLAFDSEVLYRQQGVTTSSGSTLVPGIVGQTTGLFGVRAGQRYENLGFFVHARGGFLHYGSDNGVTVLTRSTVPTFDIGGTLERYIGPMILRFDLGEMIVPYGSTTTSNGPFTMPPPPPAPPLGTRVNLSVGFGIAFRF
jgi:hypothetical protein